ncbi:double zinc ribbon domain-containing protein [Halobacterium yunchengense]|uniref:double zinc ribbon domain-containing protein n=1 Tax=Halobacterium yunchengense TaxID=3108497 RepID=UPI00300B1C83
MSKITFRADDDLVDAVENLEASKSEVMRDALRAYLERSDTLGGDAASSGDDAPGAAVAALDDVVSERVDELVERRLGARDPPERDVNVRITVEPGEGFRAADAGRSDQGREHDRGRAGGGPANDGRQPVGHPGDGASCAQCGESLSDDHVYCPNCGEKAAQRVFCECGDEVRADWAFCPHCGRRTASADAFDR